VQYVDSRDLRKERGAFFTPEPLAAFIADWALRDPAGMPLEADDEARDESDEDCGKQYGMIVKFLHIK